MSGDIENVVKMSESLFSLEVLVEKLSVPAVVCRFPAVAFRLLDFPTLIIYHVEPNLAETIRNKIHADPHYRVPPQLQELKDKSGYFIMKKGKSCLFKVSPQMLQAHLMNTPLYVMLIDTYPKVPKLLGNCTIPLDDVMTRISDDINNHGISVPSAHGERGEFKIYNLMGFEIGSITLGYRLLSLGMGLIPHIPDNAVSAFEETRTNRETVNVVEKAQQMDDMVDNIIQSIEAADKNTQVAVSEFMPVMEHVDTQTEKETSHIRCSAMQTDYQQKKKKSKPRRKDTAGIDMFSDVTKEMTDFFVTNMTCPPPLFYNSEADEAPILHQGLTFNDEGLFGMQAPKPNYAWQCEEPNESSSSSDDTIRHEDVFSDSDVEQVVDFKSSRVVHKDSQKAIIRKTKIQARSMTDKHLAQQTAKVMQNMNQQTGIKNLQQLPLLNALLKEIMALQGISLTGPVQSICTTSTSRATSAQSRQTPRDRAEREEHLRKLATPRNVSRQADHGSPTAKAHKVCADEAQTVPKNKSWISKDSDFAVHVPKTKLSYGMTNAQRLRLAKANPELLKKLEKEDQKRVEKSRERTRVKYLQYQKEAKLGERLMHSARDIPGQKSQEVSMNFGASIGSTGEQMSEAVKNHRRPIPTPRRSLSLKNEQMKEVLARMMETERSHAVEVPILGEPTDNGQRREHRAITKQIELNDDKNESPRSQKSIDVYLPSAGRHENDHEDELIKPEPTREKTHIESIGEADFGRTKTLYNPGFPTDIPSGRESRLSRPESRLTDYGQYSEDFENGHDKSVNVSSSGEEPSLRKIVQQYSDDSESQKSDAFCEEPSLRKVVDQYSTEEEQAGYETAQSQESDHSQYRPSGQVRASASSGMTLNIASMPNPTTSIHSPVAAIRPQIPLTGEGLAASSTPTESEQLTQQSTAYIRESQMPSLSETGASYDPVEELRRSVDLRPRPSPRRTLERLSSVHTESVSSYAPSDAENLGIESEDDDPENEYTESFDEDSDEDTGPAPVKQMSDLKLAPEARMGYTWGYSKN